MGHNGLHHKFLDTSFGYNLSQNILAYRLSKKSTQELSKRLKRIKAKKILDIGCSTAFYRNSLTVKSYFGIDINETHIKAAKRRFPKDQFMLMNSLELRFPGNTFDAVISKGVLHHLTEKELVKSLKESLRVCKKNGMVITLDAIQPTNKWNMAGRFLRNLDQGHHVKHWSDYKNLLDKHFRLDEHVIVSSFPYEFAVYTISKTKNILGKQL